MEKSVTVKYFASLRDVLGKSEEVISIAGIRSARDVWDTVAKPEWVQSQSVLCAVNRTYASFDAPVSAGDEVAFFPPVTGG